MSDLDDDSSESAGTSSTSSPTRGSEDELYHVVRSQVVNAYDDEPLAPPRENDDVEEEEEVDEDGLSPLTLEMRSDGRIPVNDWLVFNNTCK